jgi:hypothetical protein
MNILTQLFELLQNAEVLGLLQAIYSAFFTLGSIIAPFLTLLLG